MQRLFIAALVLNLLLEGSFAIVALLMPETFVVSSNVEGSKWLRSYALAILPLAGMLFWVLPHRQDLSAVSVALLVLLVFHGALAISVIYSLALGGPVKLGVVHIPMTLLVGFLYLRRKDVCSGWA